MILGAVYVNENIMDVGHMDGIVILFLAKMICFHLLSKCQMDGKWCAYIQDTRHKIIMTNYPKYDNKQSFLVLSAIFWMGFNHNSY